jgi:hypothetical protein
VTCEAPAGPGSAQLLSGPDRAMGHIGVARTGLRGPRGVVLVPVKFPMSRDGREEANV